MTKKEYIRPAMELIEADTDQQLLAGSLTSVTTTGLDGNNLELTEETGDSWTDVK
ncbi:MAG: hypothetical protein IIZ44_07275 [Muribaculaceae bacterium]|nr:hypothetical protein [Muribaculaceae bacterium]